MSELTAACKTEQEANRWSQRRTKEGYTVTKETGFDDNLIHLKAVRDDGDSNLTVDAYMSIEL